MQTQMAYLSRNKDHLMEKLSEAEGLSQLDQQDMEEQQGVLRELTNEKVAKQKTGLSLYLYESH